MRTLNFLTWLLIVIGGLNWLLVGIAEFDLVAAIFGGQTAPLAKLVYILVGLSAVWQILAQVMDGGRTTVATSRDDVRGPRV